MARTFAISLFTIVAGSLIAGGAAEARSRGAQMQDAPTPIVEGAPALAPFQHVRFCLRYPSDCKSDPTGNQRIDLNADTSELLKRVNRSVNAAIAPRVKDYATNLEDRWTIAPASGDCNDYAVTKRHELVASGLPARALRLSVVKTESGVGHLVLIAATTKGDLVLDNRTDAIRPWQRTGYEWLKIQSRLDARFWYAIKPPAALASRSVRRLHLASR